MTSKQMSKAQTLRLLEDFAHLANSMQLDWNAGEENILDHEGEFWNLIKLLPEDIKESVIN